MLFKFCTQIFGLNWQTFDVLVAAAKVAAREAHLWRRKGCLSVRLIFPGMAVDVVRILSASEAAQTKIAA